MARHAPFQITPQAAAELSRLAALTSRPGVASLELQPGGCQSWALIIRAGAVVGEPHGPHGWHDPLGKPGHR